MALPSALLKLQKKNLRSYLIILLVSAVLFAAAAYWNWFAPNKDYWPVLVADTLTFIPALGAALAATLLLRQFGQEDRPRPIWFWFAMGWWAWVIGEVCSLGYDLFRLSSGEFAIYDIFWTVGYLCFGLSLFFQYRTIYNSQGKVRVVSYLIIVAVTLLATLGLTQWALHAGLGVGMSWFALYLAVFYPVCDLAIGLTALWLAFLFGRGAWGRPWWGLIVFAIADGINIFLWIGGRAVLPARVADFLDPLSSTIYNGGYFIAMLGFLFILFLNFWSILPETQAVPGAAG